MYRRPGAMTMRLLRMLLLALATIPPTALAHQANVSSAQVRIAADGVVQVEIGIRGSDIDEAAGTEVTNVLTDEARPEAVAAGAAAIGAYVSERVTVAGATPCPQGLPQVRPDGDGVAVRIDFACAGVAGPLSYRSSVLDDIAAGAQQVVMVYAPGAEPFQALLDRRVDHVGLGAAERPSLLRVLADYVAAGVEHIFLGYDHVAFLVALMLWARRPWPVVKIVTAFTVAHSVTLSLAALDVVRVPATIIEPAIAASIVFVAVENFVSRDIGGRWKITFLFGFVHGFGFADALRELGLPQDALVPALAAFNVGVELGQLALVALIVPGLLLLDHVVRAGGPPTRAPATVYIASALIAVLGCWWFMARTVLA
jgi:hydrogenase/urease accessory protein HupE